MEATGGYERKLVAFLQAREIAVAVVNPKRVRDYANAMGAYAKNDRIDAHMIRHYAESAYAKNRLHCANQSPKQLNDVKAYSDGATRWWGKGP
jgi:transposase